MDSAGTVIAAVGAFAADHLSWAGPRPAATPAPAVCVALSGGADSLALTAAAVRVGLHVRALVVDHRLQAGSEDVATRAAEQARELGADAEIVAVEVQGPGGMEAAAREARYAALDTARAGRPVLLGHTLDDQAETVLMGLARGSGARSLAGMRTWTAPWGRPLLGVRRAHTVGACSKWGLDAHADPHNVDPRFTRVRLRTDVLPLLDEVLRGGVVDALGRTAESLQDDNDALDQWAQASASRALVGDELVVELLAGEPPAIRGRAIRLWLQRVGATEPTRPVIAAVDALIIRWRGQGGVAIGGDEATRRVAARAGDVITVGSIPRT